MSAIAFWTVVSVKKLTSVQIVQNPTPLVNSGNDRISEIVKAVHKDFILAGSRVVTANNYIATPLRLIEHGYGDKFFETHQLAFELLELAIAEVSEDFSNNIKLNVAGCLPPLVASYDASVALNEKSHTTITVI